MGNVMITLESLSPDALADLYGLPLRSAEVVNRGINVTYRLSAGPGQFYLRLYRPQGRTREQIDGEIAALLAFRSADEVCVAKPQKLCAGGYILSCRHHEETRFACLFAAARGRPAANNAGDMRQLGVALAVMHRQSAFFACGRSFRPGEAIDDAVRHLAQPGLRCRHISGKIRHIGAAIIANLNRHGPLPQGFCHGDAWCGNVHFAGPRTTFFDFDDCFDGPLVADLVPQIAWLWHSNRPEFPALLRVFLDAYASVLPLSVADLAVIPPLVQLHEICSIALLAKYCSLEPVTWAECLERSARMLDDWSPGGAASAHIAPLAGAARMARTRVA